MTRLLPASDPGAIDRAADLVLSGGLVAFPTETVYGLGADATNDIAVARIFEAKGRPQFNPLISHVATREMAAALGQFDDMATKLADAFWPGPLTLVLPRLPSCPVSLLASAGLDTVAIRMPRHAVAQALISQVGRPLAAPSANRSGAISPTTAQHVLAGLEGRIDAVIDAGPCDVGLESTIIAVSDGTASLLRPGGVPTEAVEFVCGPLKRPEGNAIQAPGMLASHYAPQAQIRLNVDAVRPGEALLAFGEDVPEHDGQMENLSTTGNLVEAAANLFAMLRYLDTASPQGIAVMPVPDEGIGEAINDRLRRAAAPRPDAD